MNYVADQFEDIFLTYNGILTRLHKLKITTKTGKEITELDLRKAIKLMVKKHPSCRWRSQKIFMP